MSGFKKVRSNGWCEFVMDAQIGSKEIIQARVAEP